MLKNEKRNNIWNMIDCNDKEVSDIHVVFQKCMSLCYCHSNEKDETRFDTRAKIAKIISLHVLKRSMKVKSVTL